MGCIDWFTEHGVLFIKYCSILLQALTIEADEDLLFAIYDLTKIKGLSWEEETGEFVLEFNLYRAAHLTRHAVF